MRICRTCKNSLDDSNFQYRQDTGTYRTACRSCQNEIRREVYGEKERLHNRMTRRDPARRANVICWDSRKSDKLGGLSNELTVQGVRDIFESAGCCSYCGEADLRLTLDRIDNSVGHTWDNVNVACYRCNVLRRDMPYEAWMHIVPTIREARIKGLFGSWTGGIHKVIHEKESQGVEPCQP